MQSTIEAPAVIESVKCFHCGEPCREILHLDNKSFCCQGCKTVYQVLEENNLCQYYTFDNRAGTTQKNATIHHFEYLDQAEIRRKILSFESSAFSKVSFLTPSIHCASCIWLLENLRSLHDGILKSEVNFGKKTVDIDFDPGKISLSQVAALLASIGYSPAIRAASEEKKRDNQNNLVYKLAIAGFCFGNVMLFSFPEYLGLDGSDGLKTLFSWLNLLLSIPVFFYSASGYFASAIKSFKQKQINIDVPIAVGLLALFSRSLYDIIAATGAGYLDSFTGLVFFLLIGRWFQSRTYESLAFDRDYRSYFPLAASRLVGDEWRPVVIYELKAGDKIRLRNMEIVPADALLHQESAYVDYSFVTGESKPIKVRRNELVYAGGRLMGEPAVFLVEKETNQSHLTSLWNNDAFRKIDESRYQKILDHAARRFTWIVMGLAVVTSIVWQLYRPAEMWLVITAVLCVACPCALALAAPFTFGSMLRVFGEHKFYLKNADVIERLALIDTVIFDKTGTVTHGGNPDVSFVGALEESQWQAIKLLTAASAHPLSVLVSKSIASSAIGSLSGFKEFPGKGIQASIDGKLYQAGSARFVGASHRVTPESSYVFIAIDGRVYGFFQIKIKIRPNIKTLVQRLGNKCASLLSGDSEGDKQVMQGLFGPRVQLLFNQDPHDKLAFVKSLQQQGKKVMMVGDGLNDSGALKQSDAGIAVTDDTGFFTPSCDGILEGGQLDKLDRFLDLARHASRILKMSFGISFFYNLIALSFAVTGHLTPLVAAVLMPLSSVSVVGFSTFAVRYAAQKTLGN